MSSHTSIEKKTSPVESPHVIDDDGQVPTYLGLKGQKLNMAISTMCGVGFLLFGYDQGVMGSLLTLPSFRHTFPTIDLEKNPENDTLQGFTIAVYELGCMVSALSTIYLGDRLGRLRTMLIGVIIMFIGGALQASSVKSIAFLIVARIITGLGNGFNTSTVPVYQSETAKAHNRGSLICVQGCLITFGICLSYWIDFGFYFTGKSGQLSWRFPVAFQCIFPLMMIPFILSLPESPRWLMAHGREAEARRVFAALYDVPMTDYLVNAQLEEIKQALATEEENGKFGFTDIFKQGKARTSQRVCLATFCQFMQQICGINLITYYAGTIFEDYIGLNALDSRILAACNGTEYFLASLIPIFIIEKVGRRPLFLIGTTGQCLSMLFLCVTNYLKEERGVDGAAIGAAFLLFVFNTFFGISLLSLTWLYSPEVSSQHARTTTSALSTASNWLTNFFVVMITPILFQRIKYNTYAVFAAINFVMIPVFYFLFPETKGRSLEEMDVIFTLTPANKPWESVRIARELPFIHAGVVDDVEAKYKEYIEHHEDILQVNSPIVSQA